VDIGAAGTSLMLTGGGKILYKNTVPVGGDSFSAAIVAYLLRTHKMKISTRSAEVVKKKIGTVWINRENRSLDIKGKRIDNGEMITVRLSSQEMFEALEEPTAHLLAAVCEAIGEIPSQFVGEIFHRGILLCGGGACLDGLDKMISGVTGVNARVVDLPDEVVALGLGKILADLPTSMKNEKMNVSQRCMRAEF
jgi:rod shape-determining protein MreB